jgi:hypothetical protein
MAEYQFLGETNAIPYEAPGFVVLKKYIDFADLVLNPQKLALASAPNTPLSSFAGFAAADVLNVFHIPAGTIVFGMGMYAQAVDTNASGTIALGDGTQTAGWMAATATTAGALTTTVVGDAYGSNNYNFLGYKAADTLDALGATATLISAKVHLFAIVQKCFDITSVV